MAGLAHILADWGVGVSGSDAAASALTRSLERRGIPVRIGHCPEAVAGADLVVYSGAVPPDNPERRAAAQRGIPSCLRGEFLARVARGFERVLCVAGSHGKTTTTAMLAQILREAGLGPGYLVGGMVTGWPRSAWAGAGRVLVTEVDESDGTQALMRSTVAVITNIDDDHAWSTGGLEGLRQVFAAFAGRAETVLAWDTPETRRALAECSRVRFVGPADIPPELVLPVPGEHNRRNACLALLAAAAMGVPAAVGVAALTSFRGTGRRLTTRFRAPQDRRVLIDDYAHHPAELAASLSALREAWPRHRLKVVFQPHRYERVRRYGAAFAQVLSALADEAVVVAPFAAWVDDAAGADPGAIARAVKGPPSRYWDGPIEDLVRCLAETPAREPEILAVVGAGDVGRVALQVAALWRESERTRLETALARAGIPCDGTRTWAELTALAVGSGRPLCVLPRDHAELDRARACAAAMEVPCWTPPADGLLAGTDLEPLRLVVVPASLTPGADWRRPPHGAERRIEGLFRDPPGDRAARLLAQAGCAGLRSGSLLLDARHGNAVVNTAPAASEEDLRDLVVCCRERVRDRFGIALEENLCWCAEPGA